MAERINGIKTNLDRWTDEEIVNGIGHTVERRSAADSDLSKLIGAAGVRGLIQPEPGDPNQGTLFVVEADDPAIGREAQTSPNFYQ